MEVFFSKGNDFRTTKSGIWFVDMLLNTFYSNADYLKNGEHVREETPHTLGMLKY